MNIRLHNPTGRNTQAHIVTINGNEFFFSYETCIAFRGTLKGEWRVLRLPNYWGPTTGRHFRELGCQHFELVSSDEFDMLLKGIRL